MTGPLRVLIVDDEPLARDCLRLPLASRPDIDVVGECGDGANAIDRILADPPDLVLLDIQMPGLGGFEVIDHIGSDRMPGLVFVTAHGQHAVRAFEVHALNYLMKPFTTARLHEVVDRACAQLQRWDTDETLARVGQLRREHGFAKPPAALADPARTNEWISRLLVRNKDRFRFIAIDDVLWFEAARNHVIAHLASSQHVVSSTLSELARRLAPHRFVRCHRSHILNLDAVREIQAWFGGDYIAVMSNGGQVRISRTYRDSVLRPIG